MAGNTMKVYYFENSLCQVSFYSPKLKPLFACFSFINN